MPTEIDLDFAADYIANSSQSSSVYIGCDSRRHVNQKGEWFSTYTRVVVVHIDTGKGCKLFGDTIKLRDYGSMRVRLMQEVQLATELAHSLLDSIGDRKFEIHLDINPDDSNKSSVVVKEAMGFVRGVLGVEPKVKPFANAASNAADMFEAKSRYFNQQ